MKEFEDRSNPRLDAPADAFVGETVGGHVIGAVDVAQVDQDAAAHHLADGLEVQRAELVPLRQNDERVGAGFERSAISVESAVATRLAAIVARV